MISLVWFDTRSIACADKVLFLCDFIVFNGARSGSTLTLYLVDGCSHLLCVAQAPGFSRSTFLLSVQVYFKYCVNITVYDRVDA